MCTGTADTNYKCAMRRRNKNLYQKGTTEKSIVSIQPDEKKIFTGFENLVKTCDELKEIVENSEVYEAWHMALSSVYAIYLIVDTETAICRLCLRKEWPLGKMVGLCADASWEQ